MGVPSLNDLAVDGTLSTTNQHIRSIRPFSESPRLISPDSIIIMSDQGYSWVFGEGG